MSQEGQEFVCNGALCRCDKGTVPSPLQVTSQSFVWLQDKLQATNLDKTFVPFGSCGLKYNGPCVPAPLLWENVFDLVTLQDDGCHPLLEKSTIRCAVGGVISIINTLQVAIPAPPLPAQAETLRTTLAGLFPLLLNDAPAEEPTSPSTDK